MSGIVGQTVSHYRIVAAIGAGGMGVVYRALDLHLGREVAIKFLPSHLAHHPNALARFDRESRLASAINNPHICLIHDVGQHDGQPYIVMELCTGRTVQQLIDAGPVPIPELVEIALQTAEALDAAHRRGVIHRDVKPANVMVSPGGHVKVLDFGVAKFVDEERAPAVARATDSTTDGGAQHDLTKPGIAVGTVAYMSPEQASGLALDARSDLFSFGAVLYEAATGTRAFPGSTAAVVFDQILNREPVLARELLPEIPAELDEVISKLLVKSRDLRYQTAAQVLADLRRVKRRLEARDASSEHVADEKPTMASSVDAARRRGRWRLGVVCAVVLTAALIGIGVANRFTRSTSAALSERDAILLLGMENQTGEQVFDSTLSQALAVHLGQSPFLNIVPEDRVQETLRLMGRPPDEQPTGEVARDLCRRLGVKAMVDGSISRMGRLYVLHVGAKTCETGASLVGEQGSAETQEDVLNTLGRVSSALRAQLGESLKSVEQFDVPVVKATTPSLEALKAYTLGLTQRTRGAEVESIPFFERALELDPGFAAAATTLSTVYGNLGEPSRSEEYARLAYENRGHVSERERLFITYQYHDRVTGDQMRAAETLEVWKQTYPADFRPANALALLHNRLGRFEQGVAEAKEALRRKPGHPFPLSNLAHAYRGLNRFDEARRTSEEAVALGVETVPTRRLLYQLAVLDGNTAVAQRQLEWARGRPREFDLVSAEAQAVGYTGKVKAADELYRSSVELAERRSLPEAAAAVAAHQAWMHAVYGDRTRALAAARFALRAGGDRDTTATSNPRFRALVALALVGATETDEIVSAAARRYPESTFAGGVLIPATRAAAELSRGRPGAAIEWLRAAAPYELGFSSSLIPVYLRGQAYLAQGAGTLALAEFQKIIDHRGSDPFSPVSAAAHLGLARARRLMGERENSIQGYEAFRHLWRDADPDVPILIDANKEFRRLTSSAR